MSGPLSGVRVFALAGLGSAPFASMLLADMGAHVIRVRRPSAVSDSSWAAPEDTDVVNRGVQSITLDLKDERQHAAGLALASKADVFIEGFRPGVAERLGLGPDVLLAARPALVYARLTGYGQAGPLAHRAGHDINYVAQSGVLHALGRPGEAPRPPLNLLGDYAGGGMLAAFGIVCGLLESRTSGVGQVVDAAIVDGVALLTAKLQGLRAADRRTDLPGANVLDGGAPFYDIHVCADGAHLAVGALEPQFYRAFIDGLGVDASAWPDREDRAAWPRLRALIGGVIAGRSRDYWVRVFDGTDACVTAVLDFDEAERDAHNMHRRLYHRSGAVLHPTPAPRFSRSTLQDPDLPIADPLTISELCRLWDAVPDSATVSSR